MKERNLDSDLVKLMSKIYKKEQVAQRIENITIIHKEEVTYMQMLFDPAMRRSTWVGINLSMF